jgi:zinc transport system substrate-binding protein
MKYRSCLGLVVVALLAGCSQANVPTTPTAQDKLPVAASFYPLAYLSQQIGGDNVSVTQVTPGGVEPHDYEPTPQDLVAVHKAKVFVMNGGGVDGWADKVLDDLKQNGVITVRMLDTISPMVGFSENGEIDPLKPSSESTNVQDPHIWLDPVYIEKEATLILDAFISADASHADQYRVNTDALIAKLTTLDQSYGDGLKVCKIHAAVVSHNAFRYIAKEYDFQTLAIAGLSTDEEPSAKRLAELSDFARKNGVKYIFFETLVSPKLAQTVADSIGAQSLVLNPIEGLTPDDVSKGTDYLSIMQDNLQNLRTAMQCQ